MSESETDWEFPASRPLRSIAAYSIAVDRETSLIVKVDSRGSNKILKGKSMLILSRKEGECISLRIPPSDKERTIRVTVTDMRKISVKLGFDADKDVRILRDDAKEVL